MDTNLKIKKEDFGAIFPGSKGKFHDPQMIVRAKFGLAEVAHLQCAVFAGTDAAGEDADVDVIVEKIVGQFATMPAIDMSDLPKEEWLERVTGYLRIAPDDAVERAAAALGLSGDEVRQVRLSNGHRFFAAEILARGLDEPTYFALGKLKEPPMNNETFSKLVSLVVPTWVNEEAAQTLLNHALRWDPRPPVGLNTKYTNTFLHYIDRATCCANTGYHKTTLGETFGEGGAEELVANAENKLKITLSLRPDANLPKTLTQSKMFRAVLLGIVATQETASVVAAAAETLRERYRWLTVTVLFGTEDMRAAGMEEMIVIMPEVDSCREEKSHQLVGLLEALLEEHR